MDCFCYSVDCIKENLGGGNRVLTFHDFWSLKIVNKNEGLTFKWNRIDNTFNIPPRFGSVVNYISDKNILFLHAGQNFLMNECYADFYKIKLNINQLDSQVDNKSIIFILKKKKPQI